MTVAIDVISNQQERKKKKLHSAIDRENDIGLTFGKTRQMRLTTRLNDDNKILLLSQYLTEPIGLYIYLTREHKQIRFEIF